jgi:hypothetical protein
VPVGTGATNGITRKYLAIELAERKEADADRLATVNEKVEAPSTPVEGVQTGKRREQ